ncbi:DUF262 domain-containing protein [Alteribacillus sp. JSM 102045]|uniref:DUF262 domain-containing protein n=1 Tax=Alteribacillus sp. JSM 102045 TaxID=1562101 RepID=UPI0035C0ED4B
MSKIDAQSRTIRELLSGTKYGIDYYQREYKWDTKNIRELLQDLETKFLSNHHLEHEREEVQHYENYFLGSIVISEKQNQKFIIDGQQRLTSLTMLLIYLHNLQIGFSDEKKVDVSDLIFSIKFGKKSFNLNVPERDDCVNALFSGQVYDPSDQSESVRNIVYRYKDIEEEFPNSLKGDTLPYFIDWLLEKVILVEIVAHSDDDAYTIFETMNDRGLSLNQTDMLKGYLLANIKNSNEKEKANQLWKSRVLELIEIGKEEEVDFFKTWLRAKYARTIRERKKGAKNQDFDKIGTEFHKWVRDNKQSIGLNNSSDFLHFIKEQLVFFSKQYIKIRKAAQKLTASLESVYYNAHNNFTLQYPLLLAPLRLEDDQNTVDTKIQLVSYYIDNFIVRRAVNFRTLGYSSIVYTMFNLMKEIRDLDVISLSSLLKKKLDVNEMKETIDGVKDFRLHQQNYRYVRYVLARITHYIENQSGVESNFETYISRNIKKPFEIEHIWADQYERYSDEFDSPEAFMEYRNRIGGLLLIPRGFNQSYGKKPYEEKVSAYFGQNLLAQSLNGQCYQNNPSFLAYIERSGLPFKPYPHSFKKEDLDERQELYRLICQEIWNPSGLEEIVQI